MPDDVTTPDEVQDDLTPVAHDDIMKRLLDYQRQLREGDDAAPGEGPPPMVHDTALETQAQATATATEEIVDLTAVEEDEIEVLEVIEVDDVVEVEAVPEDPKVAEADAMLERAAEEATASEPEEPSASTEPEPVVPEAAMAEVAAENLAERVAELEAALDRIGMMLTAVRSDFQDLAIRADERISEIEESLAAVRGSSF